MEKNISIFVVPLSFWAQRSGAQRSEESRLWDSSLACGSLRLIFDKKDA